MSKLIAFGWYGGKFSHLDWLLPLLPKVTHYCEPFGGSAAVLINRIPDPVETYNDLDGELVNFFQVLREQNTALIKAIALTPFSRQEFELSLKNNSDNLSSLERARRFFVRARQVRTGLAQTASSGRWAHCLLTSRAGMAGAVSRWLGSIEGLAEIAQRLQRVQIENQPAIDVIKRYDSPETLFYCDPPYPHDSRGDRKSYRYEMTDEEHRKLAHILHHIKGKVAISGYHGSLMDQLYPDWHCIEAPAKKCHATKDLRTEVLWVNYSPSVEFIQPAFPSTKNQKNLSSSETKERTKKMLNPWKIMTLALEKAKQSIQTKTNIIADLEIIDQIEFICRNPQNRAGARLLLACSLAKVHQPDLDIRKPYTEIDEPDAYSGRSYDENYITEFIFDQDLPCNSTTAFLTPALRTRNLVLNLDANLVGKPRQLYQKILQIFDAVYQHHISAEDLLAETIKWLLIVRDENRIRTQTLIANLKTVDSDIPLSATAILKLIQQHLNCRHASRLPVLIIAAIYQIASEYLGASALPLKSHNAADQQTGALGDVEITLINEDQVICSYEIKMKPVTVNDINQALKKINQWINEQKYRVNHYIFITTETINEDVKKYAESLYDQTGGIEFCILDCLGFLEHFLHLFHRLRIPFLDAYQERLLAEPDSAVNPTLKEAFLILRTEAIENCEEDET